MKGKHLLCLFLSIVLLLMPLATTVLAADRIYSGQTQSGSGISTETDVTTGNLTTQGASGQNSGHSEIVWWVMLAAVVCIAVLLMIFRKKIFKKLPRILSIIITSILALALIVPAAALAFPQAADTLFGSGGVNTVSFETNGGSEVEAVEVPSGGKLGNIPTPMKTDNSFTGWYTDTELTTPFYSDAAITNDMTLYASYTPTQTNAAIYEDPGKYVEDCDSNYFFSIVSPVELTSNNLADHVLITAYIGQLPELKFSGKEGVYTISPASPYTGGGHYRFDLLDETLSFEGETSAVRTLDFRIYKDDTNVVELNDNIVYVMWLDVITLGDNAYYVPASLGVEAGDTVCFWNGELGEDTRFFNVLIAAAPIKSMSLLTMQESQITDVVDKLDVHFNNDVLTSDFIQGINTDQLAYDAKNSEGTRQMTTLLANAISQSPSFLNLVSETFGDNTGAEAQSSAQTKEDSVQLDGESFVPIEENDDSKNYVPVDLITQSLDENLTVTAYVATAQNENFYNAGSDDWTVLSLTFTYDATIKDKLNIKVEFTIKECIKTTAQGDAWIEDDEYTIEDFFSTNIIPDMYFDFALNNYSQTDISLTVLIKTVDTSDDDYLDITKELEEMTQPGDESDTASFLEEVLGDKGDYIDLVDIPLITISQAIIPECPVLQLNIDLNFVVKVNFAAGISAQATIMSAKQAGISGDTRDGFDSYDNTLIGNNRYTFDFYCAGYLGLKAGLKLSFSLSVYGMPGLGKAGFSGEIGAYLDLYGFMHLNISKLWQYSDNKDFSLQGGLYMEVGIYVELQAFAKSDWFKTKASKTLWEKKFPLLTVGNQYVLLRFTDDTGSVIMNEDQFALYGSAGLLDAEYVDMKTGSIVTSAEIEDMSDIMPNFSVQFSSPYFEYDEEDYMFSVLKSNFGTHYDSLPYVDPNAMRVDATVYVYYTGGNLAFSHQEGGDTMKQVSLTWIDPSIDISLYSDIDAVQATYVVDIDGEQQQVAQNWVPFGSIPGFVDYGAYVNGCKFIGYTNDPTQPIFEDTTYTIQLKRYQRLVSYLTYHDGSWHFDVYAAAIGDVPSIPDGYDDPGEGLSFTGWIGTPGASSVGLGMAGDVTAVNYDATFIFIDENNNLSTWNPSGEYVYLNLDTTTPLYSVSGTYDECYNNYYSHLFIGASFNKSSQYLYEAQYDGGPYTVNMVYPAMSYMYCGQPQKYSETTYSFEVEFNDPISITNMVSYPGCSLPEWDEDGDGIADYDTFAELPRATHDITLSAIFKLKTYTVTVLNIDNEVKDTLTVSSGALPAIIKTEPKYPDGDDYLFAYWAMSKSGGDFAEWDQSNDPGVFADWTIKPVYEQAYDVTFDYDGGTYDGNSAETIKLIAGTYAVANLIGYFPVKEADEHNTYIFDGWSCGRRFTVSGNMTITAEYTATPIIYTTEFNTATGEFLNGDNHASHTGDYDSTQDFTDGFLAQNGTLETVYTADKVYTFENWEEISLSATHIWYEAQWSWEYRKYTVTFDAGDGIFSNGDSTKTAYLPYGTSATLSAVSANIITPEIEGYAYDLTGWKDQADNAYGTSQGFTVYGDTTFTAQYTQGEHILYTVTLNANGGTFSGGETTLMYSGYYEEATGISVASPTRVSSASYDYVFDSWSAAIPTQFTETVTITARWQQDYRDYTVTFDANGGTFTGGATTIDQTYHYNDTVTPPSDPAIAEDDDYTYEFTGWSPSVSAVTENCTYIATWKANLKDGLAETGIIVSDGINSEDINYNGALVSGYTCELQYLNSVQVPVLTIQGDGLTFSGSNGTVYIDIASGCSSVTFDSLSLSGAYPNRNAGVLVVPDVSTDTVTINVLGSCELTNTSDGKGAFYSLRPVVLSGAGAGSSSFSISSVGRDALYSTGLKADSLTLNVNAAAGSDTGISTYAITGEGSGSNPLWRFADANVTAQGMGAIGIYGSVVLEGSSTVTLVSTDNAKAPLLVFGEDPMGYLKFLDFTGSFSASYQDTAATGPAVQAIVGITFAPDISDYNFGGAEVILCDVLFDSANSYYTFAVGGVAEASVHVMPD